jgi:hypothetical protein
MREASGFFFIREMRICNSNIERENSRMDPLQGFKTVAEILIKAVGALKKRSKDKRTREDLLDLVTAFYCIRGITRTGYALLELSERLKSRIHSMPDLEVRQYATYALKGIGRQFHRMRVLGNVLERQPVLDLLDPDLRAELRQVIGSKEEGLFAIAAALGVFLSPIHWIALASSPAGERERQILTHESGLIDLMYSGNDQDRLDPKLGRTQLADLEAAAERLRRGLRELLTRDEMLELSREAELRVKGPPPSPSRAVRRSGSDGVES